MKSIDLADFPQKPESDLYGSNQIIQHIASFYEKYPQDDIYMVVVPEDVFLQDVLVTATVDLYHSYGIYFSNVDTVVSPVFKRIFSIEECDVCSCCDCIPEDVDSESSFTVLFKTSYTKEELRPEERAAITSFNVMYPNAYIANSELRPTLQYNYSDKLDGYCVKELELDLGSGTNIYTSAHKMEIIKDVIDRGRSIPDWEGSSRTVIRIVSQYKTTEHTSVACGIAAILNGVYGKNVYVSSAQREAFNSYLIGLNKRQNMFLSEYLDSIANPICCGIFLKKYPSIFLRNRELEKYDNPVQIMVHSTEFDTERLECVDLKLTSENLALSEIEVLRIEEVYGLESDYSMERLHSLHKLLTNFDSALRGLDFRKSNKLLSDDESLDCTNVLLFRHDGKVRLGYVSLITGSITYAVKLLNKEKGNFIYNLDVTDYHFLTNYTYFEDGENILRFLQTKAGEVYAGLKQKREYPERVWAFVAGQLTYNEEIIKPDGVISPVQIGLYYPYSAAFRDSSNKEAFLQYFDTPIMWEEQFLTFYGGPHVSEGSKLFIKPRMWR